MSLSMRNISFTYQKGGRPILDDLVLDIAEGDVYALLGGSGSGKTTVLNIIAGFLEPKKGNVLIKGKDVTSERVHGRNIGIVFQEYALFPHMSVEANIAFGLRTRSIRSDRVNTRVKDVMELVGLSGYEKKAPSELSGGERQRVALSRALVYEPDLLLLDEPLSALDASLREGLRKELRTILKGSGTTALYVTHDQLEAIAVSDHVGYLKDGRVFEEGAPEEMYWHPKRIDTARFMGVSNIIDVTGSTKNTIETSIGTLPWTGVVPDRIGFRPESFSSNGNGIKVRCKVKGYEYRGKETQVDLDVNGIELKGSLTGKVRSDRGSYIEMDLDLDQVIPFKKMK